jgi:hypothetical protein
MIMPAPLADPEPYDSAGSPGPADYRPGQRIWVHRAGSWRPGIVLYGSPQAVTVRYRPADGAGTGVDTVTSRSLAVRDDNDPCLDGPALGLAS